MMKVMRRNAPLCRVSASIIRIEVLYIQLARSTNVGELKSNERHLLCGLQRLLVHVMQNAYAAAKDRASGPDC